MKKTIISLLLMALALYGCGGGSSTGSSSVAPPTTEYPNIGGNYAVKLELSASARIVNTGNAITLTVKASDTSGQGVSGATVVLTSTGGGTLNTNYITTGSSGAATATIYSTIAGSTTVKAMTNNLVSLVDLYFVDGEIKDKLTMSVDADGDNIYDETNDFSVSGTTGEKIKIRARFTDAGGYAYANKKIKFSSGTSVVTFDQAEVNTDSSGYASTFMTFTNKVNTVYVDVVGESDSGTVGSLTLKVNTFVVGDILLYSDKYTIYTNDTAKIKACLVSENAAPIKLAEIKVNFAIAPAGNGEIMPFAFTDDTGCASTDLKATKNGDIVVTASNSGLSKDITIKVNKAVSDIMLNASKYSIKTGETATATACVLNSNGEQQKQAGLKIDFTLTPSDLGYVAPGSAITDSAGCAQTVFTATKNGSAKIKAAYSGIEKEITITVGSGYSAIAVTPAAPSVKVGDTILVMITGGAPSYTVTSLNPSLTDPDSWTVASNGGTFSVKGMAAGTATLTIMDAAGNFTSVTLTVSP